MLTLFTIESYANHEEGLAIMPGVPRQLFQHAEVRSLRQGSVVQLKLPDGSVRDTIIQSYFVSVAKDSSDDERSATPIILVVKEDVRDIPVGTKVEIAMS